MFLRAILDFLFPRYCAICGDILPVDEDTICHQCDEQLPRTFMWQRKIKHNGKYKSDDIIFQETEDSQNIESNNSHGDEGETDNTALFQNNALAKRYWGRAEIERAVAFLKYVPNSNSAKLVYDFKYHGKSHTALSLGQMMAKEILSSGFFDGIDCIIPVPLTRKRLARRGYNQSKELAKGIRKVTNITIIDNVLRRSSFSVSQTKLTHEERLDNVNNSFYLSKCHDSLINKHILLIDDIVTTGATTLECYNTLKQIQGIRISILSLGFVSHI